MNMTPLANCTISAMHKCIIHAGDTAIIKGHSEPQTRYSPEPAACHGEIQHALHVPFPLLDSLLHAAAVRAAVGWSPAPPQPNCFFPQQSMLLRSLSDLAHRNSEYMQDIFPPAAHDAQASAFKIYQSLELTNLRHLLSSLSDLSCNSCRAPASRCSSQYVQPVTCQQAYPRRLTLGLP